MPMTLQTHMAGQTTDLVTQEAKRALQSLWDSASVTFHSYLPSTGSTISQEHHPGDQVSNTSALGEI